MTPIRAHASLLTTRSSLSLQDKNKLPAMRAAMLKLGAPDAAFAIADAILQRRVLPIEAAEAPAAAEEGRPKTSPRAKAA